MPIPSSLRRFAVLALAFATAAARVALAADAPAATPAVPAADTTSAAPAAAPAVAPSSIDSATTAFEVSEAARKAYAQGIADARALLAQKKYADAIAKLDALSKERPRDPQARFLKAVALADDDKADAAIAVYRSLTADYPELPEPHNNLAVLYSKKGELALARDELQIAVQAAPDYVVARENLGDVYAALAAEQYDKAATLDKRNRTAPAKLKLVRDATAVAP